MNTPSLNSVAQTVARIRQSMQVTVEDGVHQVAFHAMSTRCRVSLHGVSEAAAQEIQRDTVEWVGLFEARFSRFIPDSVVGRINANAGESWTKIDPELELILNESQELFQLTEGAFDPSVLPLVRLWDWKANSPAIPSAAAIAAALELVGWNKIQRRPGEIFLPRKGMCLDLGGVGKEYAVDCVFNRIIQSHVPHVLVDFGQDVRAFGHAPDRPHWLIGLEDPQQPGKCWAAVAATNHAVATSGDYQRHFQRDGRRYGHIIDPRTGYPVRNDIRAVSVIAPTCTLAGLLATSACILGAEEVMELVEQQKDVAAAITTETARICSDNFAEFMAV